MNPSFSIARSMLWNFGLRAKTRSTYPLSNVLPITKLMEAAIAALNRHVAVPGTNPNRYPELAVRMGT